MKKFYPIILITGLLVLSACSKRTVTTTSTKEKEEKTASTTSSTEATATPKREPVKTPTPKFITVNDKIAKRTPEGRMYYDLEGKRYWKNFKDGKYYLYTKGLLENPDFKP
jgi:hypothetical protein